MDKGAKVGKTPQPTMRLFRSLLIPSRSVKTILITGGSGFIARYFIERLKEFKVHNLDLKEPDFQSHATYFKGDIRKAEDVWNAMQGADTLIHLAAMHHDFGIRREEYFQTNAEGARILAEQATKAGIRQIINFSSVAVYGNAGNPGPTTESTPVSPNSPYGESKWIAEQVFSDWASQDPQRKVVTIRSTVVFGPWNLANVLNLIKMIHRGFYLHIGQGNNIKSLAYAGNIADAALYALRHCQPGLCLLNYSDEPQLSSRQIAEMQAAMLNRKIRFHIPYSLGILLARPFDWLIALTGINFSISSNRVKKLLTQTWHSAPKIRQMGFQPKTSIEQGMQQMINWYLEGLKKD